MCAAFDIDVEAAEKARLEAVYERMLSLSEAKAVSPGELRALVSTCSRLGLGKAQLAKLSDATDAVDALFDKAIADNPDLADSVKKELGELRRTLRGA